jgi:hypothetical protein
MADIVLGSEALPKPAAQPAITETLDDTLQTLRGSREPIPDSIKEVAFKPAVVHGPGIRERAADVLRGLGIGRREKPELEPEPTPKLNRVSAIETRAVEDPVSGTVTDVLKPPVDMRSGALAERLGQGAGVIKDEDSEEDKARQTRIAAAIQRGSDRGNLRVAAQQKGQDPDAAEVAAQPAATAEEALEQLRQTTISDNPQSPSTDV